MGSEASEAVQGRGGTVWWPADMPHRFAAEVLGTALLILFGPGSVLAALRIGEGTLDYAGLGMIAVSFGLVVAAVIYAFGTVSGAHINPAVTIALAATKRFPAVEVLPYIVAQLLGAVLGGLLLVGIFGTGSVDLGVGWTELGEGVGAWQGTLAEAVGTFLLMVAIMAMAVDRRAPAGWAGWMIGLTVTCSILVIGPLTGCAINPARTFGPYVAAAVFGGETPWWQLGVYTAGPIVGALLGAVVYGVIARPHLAAESREPAQS
jgi:glycerol uptake facilitator protein